MLRIHVSKTPLATVQYFLSLSKDDYFFTGKETKGYFKGELMDELGLPKQATQKAFRRLIYNRHPVTNEQLTPLNKNGRICNIEYNFNAPKSLSILAAMSNENVAREILNAHRYAVRQAMKEIENNFVVDTKINGRRQLVKSEGIVYAHFVHFTSRPTKELEDQNVKYSSDPNLHSHCIVPNIGKYNGRYLALEGGGIHRSASYYESVYHSHLSKRLADLKFDIRRTKDRYEIYSLGMTKKTLDRFSRRSLEINELAKKLDINNAKTKSKLGAATRVKKSKEDKGLDLKSLWLSKLTEKEFEAIQNPKSHFKAHEEGLNAKQAIDRALQHNLERRSVVPVKKLLSHALNLGYGRLLPQDVQRELNARQNIIYGKTHLQTLLTTKEVIRSEDTMLEWVSSRKGTMRPLNPDYEIKQEFLNDQQKGAIHTLVNTSKDQISILLGGAGTGKTTVLKEILWAAKEKNQKVIALAPSAIASRDVLQSVGGFEKADTIASFLKDKDLHDRNRNSTIIIDEASMIGIGTFHKIRKIATKYNNRLIFSGDPSQLNSPERGDALRLIIDKVKPTIGAIKTIQRQKPNPRYKEAIELIAKGEMQKGYDRLEKMGAIVEICEEEKRLDYVAKQYLKSIEAKRSVLVVAPTNKECLKVNEKIREGLKSKGRIHSDDRSFIIHRNLSFTSAQKQDVKEYEQGMRLQFFKMVKGGIKAGVHYEVEKKSGDENVVLRQCKTGTRVHLPLDAYENFEVYKTEEIKLSIGDKIAITQNAKTEQGTRIYNGQSFKIKSFMSSGNIELSTGKILRKDIANINYGYCVTVHKSQGKTSDSIIVSIGDNSLPAVSEKTFYVAASRAKKNIKIITQNKEALYDAVTKSGDRMSGRELADKNKQKSRERLQRRYYELQTQQIQKDERSKDKHRPNLQRAFDIHK